MESNKINNTEENIIPISSNYILVDLAKNETISSKETGIFIWLIRDECDLPAPNGMVTPKFTRIKIRRKTYRVLYVGIAKTNNKGLKIRFNQFIRGKVSTCTFRYSLAALFGFYFETYISGNNVKVRIKDDEELFISRWIQQNCLVLYKEMQLPTLIKPSLINDYDPPLNIDDNPNKNNPEFIYQLRCLRNNESIVGMNNTNASISSNKLMTKILYGIFIIALICILYWGFKK